MKIRSHPFHPFHPFCHHVAFSKKRRSLKNAKRENVVLVVVVNKSNSEAAL
jgi:hypothetical protein